MQNYSNPYKHIPKAIFDSREKHLTDQGYRPIPFQDCRYFAFQQEFEKGDLEYNHLSGMLSDIVVIIGPEKDACVYFDGSFYYKVDRPNEKFFQDLGKLKLLPKSKIDDYEIIEED